MFIDHEKIYELLTAAENVSDTEIDRILDKAARREGLEPFDVAKLLQIQDSRQLQKLYKIAGNLKNAIYGDRIVIFAPLYISDYCVNNCKYCGYQKCNGFERKKLSQSQIQEEVRILASMGHKRIALEAGEDPINCPIDYVLESIDTIYNTKTVEGYIRRINVNIAATSVADYKRLKEKGIGTYILFQETYHKPTYEAMHPHSLKSSYDYHLTAFDRAMEAGIDDVGAGVLFGLYDYKFEVLGLMLHNAHLEETFGVGFHTISVPRLKKADGINISEFPLVDDDAFRKLVAIIRLAVPFTGMILSTREPVSLRTELIHYGISQVSAGSCTGVGAYKEQEQALQNTPQFEVADHRTPIEVIESLLEEGMIPSYCTACYRNGRTGDRFMRLAKTGQIQNVCQPNALMTLMEFILDYGNPALYEKGTKVIYAQAQKIPREDIRNLLLTNLEKIKNGERDLFL